MNLRIAFITALVALTSIVASAQKNFEGTIVYDIEYLSVPAEVEGMESMLPSQMSMQFSGDWMRLEQEVMGGSQSVVVNSEEKISFILMDMMGQKIVMRIPKEQIEAQEAATPEPEIFEERERKEIAGYKCQKALIKQADGSKVEVFYTKDLGDIRHNEYKKLPGFPLQYVAEAQGMKTRITASKVTPGKLSEDIFKVPDGYTEMSQEDMMRMGQ